jgi:hypothetical protein
MDVVGPPSHRFAAHLFDERRDTDTADPVEGGRSAPEAGEDRREETTTARGAAPEAGG